MICEILCATETIRLIRDGEKGGGGGAGAWLSRGVVGGRRLCTYRYTVTTRMTPAGIKMGNDESHFNVCEGQKLSHQTL